MALIHLHGNTRGHHVLVEVESEVYFDEVHLGDLELSLVETEVNDVSILVLQHNKEPIIRQCGKPGAAVQLHLYLLGRFVDGFLGGLDRFYCQHISILLRHRSTIIFIVTHNVLVGVET